MSGYRASTVASVLAGTAARRSRIEGGDVDGCAVDLDLRRAWPRVSHRVRMTLSPYIDAEEKPPAEDAEILLARVRAMQLRQEEGWQAVSATIRHIRAVYALGREMSGKSRKPFVVNAGPAHRGDCAVCGRFVQDELVWRDLAKDQRWCVGHGPEAIDLARVGA